MANKVLLKKSSVASKVPLTTDLDYGELALNYADGKLYYKTAVNTIESFNAGAGAGSASDSFKNIAVSGQDTVVADSSTDTLTLVGSGIDITTNASTDTITLSNSGVTSLSAGTGISVSASTGSISITNTSPDQVVSLTGAGSVSVTGTYPNFTITGTASSYTAGSGLLLVGTEFFHADTSSVSTLTASTRTYVTGLTFDTFGHVTGYTTGTETVTDTTYGISAETATGGVNLRLTGSNSTTDDVKFVAGTNVTITRTDANTISISANDTSVDWSEIQNKPDPVITLDGDLTGSVTLTDLGSATLTATIAANSVALGTDTTGNYMNDISAGSGISVSHTPGEGSTATISHADTSSAANLTASSRTYVTGLTFDTFGHVTGYTTGTETVTDTTYTAGTGLSLTGTVFSIDSTVATLTGTQTLTNKTISGATNTITNIGNSSLTNSSITINGNTVSLGGSTTVTATATNALTIGTGLTGTSYNGSAAITIAIDSTVVTLSGNQTLTNKTITSPTISGGAVSFSDTTDATSATVAPVEFAGGVGIAKKLYVGTDLRVGGDVTIDGNLTVSGTTVTVNATNLAVEDNMIYLNSGSTTANPDLGIAGNYNDGTYRHAGFFRDATDGYWKVFHQYTLEPDASAFIDTAHASFALADIQAANFRGALVGNADTATKLATARTINGTSFDGSANITVTANTTNALTIGTGLSGTSFNGSSAVTIAIDSTVATLTGTQTLTNKTLTDNTTYFQDETDNTKKFQFQLSGISTATTRILTVPNASGTIALTSDIVTYSTATSSTNGLIKLGSATAQTVAANAVTSTASRTYAVQLNASGQAVVNVPWVDTDTNTTYAISAETTTGGVNLRLTGSDASTDDVKLAAGPNITLTRTDANTITIESTASGGSSAWIFKTSNYTASASDRIIATTTSGSFTITLPASPSAGDEIIIADGDNWQTNNLIVNRNGSTIKGLAENLIMDMAGVKAEFVYSGSTWLVFAFASGADDILAISLAIGDEF